MDQGMMNILTNAIVAVFSSATTLIIAKSTNKKDITISDRQLLSEDEKAFRQELRDTINGYKTELEEARNEIKELRQEVSMLRKENMELVLENKELSNKVDSLLTYSKRGE